VESLALTIPGLSCTGMSFGQSTPPSGGKCAGEGTPRLPPTSTIPRPSNEGSSAGACPGVRTYLRVAKRLVTERHLPRPLRLLLAFAILPIPGPVDEAALDLGALMIATFYRPRLKAVLHEERSRSD